MSRKVMRFKYGTKVKIDGKQFGGAGDWDGEVVGVSQDTLLVFGDVYIVKVTSGQIPNQIYPYDTCVVFCHSIRESDFNLKMNEWIINNKVSVNSCPYIEENEEVLPNELPEEITYNIIRERSEAIDRFTKKTGETDIVKIFTKVFGNSEKVFDWTSIWTFSSNSSTLYVDVNTHEGIKWEYDKTKSVKDVIPLIYWVIDQINKFDESRAVLDSHDKDLCDIDLIGFF